MQDINPSGATRREKLALEVWIKGKPQPPQVDKPVKHSISIPPRIASLLIGTCALLGVATMSFGIALWNMNGVAAFFILFAATLGISVVLPIAIIESVDRIQNARYRRRAQRADREEYPTWVDN